MAPDGAIEYVVQCCYPPCDKPVTQSRRGTYFCNSHEYRWRLGSERRGTRRRGLPLDEAIRSVGWTVTHGGCWEWNGYRSGGYGRFRGEPVTRIMWRITTGEVVSPDLHMCHRCDNPPCVNPDHLFVGTRSDNMRDMVAKGRHRYVRGGRNHRAKLTDEQVAEIRNRYTGAWGEYTALGKEYGVSAQHIRALIRGDRR